MRGTKEKEEFDWKEIAALAIIALGVVVATLAWRGDAGIPGPAGGDHAFHVYNAWFVGEKLKSLDFFFDFDFYKNNLFSRTYSLFSYFVSGPFVALLGPWNGISMFVRFALVIASLGVYFLSKSLGAGRAGGVIAALAFIWSFPLVLDLQAAGSFHRAVIYAALPWALLLVHQGKRRDLLLAGLVAAFMLGAHVFLGFYALIVILLCAFFWHRGENSQKLLARTALLLLPIGIASFHLLPFALEAGDVAELSAYGVPSRPAELFAGFFQRDFKVETYAEPRYYLGYSVVLLALWGALGKRFRSRSIPVALFSLLFVAIAAFPFIVPTLLQPTSFIGRELPLTALGLALLAGFGAPNALERLRSPKIKYAVVLLIVLVLALDLMPWQNVAKAGFLPYPTGANTAWEIKGQLAEIAEAGGRHRYADAPDYTYYLHASTVYTRKPGVNWLNARSTPEYNEFMRFLLREYNLYPDDAKTSVLNALSLLDVERVVARGTKARINSEPGLKPVGTFKPTRVALLKAPDKRRAEEVFQEIISFEEYEPTKILFLLPQEGMGEKDVDYVVSGNYSGGLGFAEIRRILAETRPGEKGGYSIDFRSNAFRLRQQVREGEWTFASLMWYPHWVAFGEDGSKHSVFQAGGGLTAILTAAPATEIRVEWERPWYDYAASLISIVTLIVVAWLYLRREETN